MPLQVALLADAMGIDKDDILVQSTGVIGMRMKMEAFRYGAALVWMA